jgi:CheY-like chemotaxis protein
MAEATQPRVVVIINANDRLANRVKQVVEAAGFAALNAQPSQVGSAAPDIQQFLRRQNARVVVFDVADPYMANWRLAESLRYNEMISGSWRQVVVTTADKQALDAQVVSSTNALELNEKNFDAAAVLDAVNRAVLV